MAERSGEQERRANAASLLREEDHTPNSVWFWFPVAQEYIRAYLALLDDYDKRSKAFERAAADCVRLEEALEQKDEKLRELLLEVEGYRWTPKGQQVYDGFAPKIGAALSVGAALAATPKPVVEEESADA